MSHKGLLRRLRTSKRIATCPYCAWQCTLSRYDLQACVCECGRLLDPPAHQLPRPLRRCSGKRPQAGNCRLSTSSDAPQPEPKRPRVASAVALGSMATPAEEAAPASAEALPSEGSVDASRVAAASAASEGFRSQLKGLKGAYDAAYLRWSEGVPWRAGDCPKGHEPIAFDPVNVRTPGTSGYARYDVYKSALTVRAAQVLGATRADVRHDFDIGSLVRREQRRRKSVKPKLRKKPASARQAAARRKAAAAPLGPEGMALMRARSAVDRTFTRWTGRSL